MLNFACAEKARKRVVTLTRPSREDPLRFSLMGGYERGFGVFVERVEAGSKASEVGLKRGDQIIEVNRQSFEHNMTLQRAVTFLKDCTHLEMVVKSNLLGECALIFFESGSDVFLSAPGDVKRYKIDPNESVRMRTRVQTGSKKPMWHFLSKY